jgi:hypothetical protein
MKLFLNAVLALATMVSLSACNDPDVAAGAAAGAVLGAIVADDPLEGAIIGGAGGAIVGGGLNP